MNSRLETLATRSFEAWSQALVDVAEVVVRPAIPILYFGDLEAYSASDKRVLTVGLNPSHDEFPRDTPFRRFPLADNLERDDINTYLLSLNEYFRRDPYRSWFGTFEPLLNGLGASYYLGAGSVALHTDLCSPIATDPTWNRLTRTQRQALIETGRPLWHQLVRALEPDVLLVSVARVHLDAVDFIREGDPWLLDRVERSRPYDVTVSRIRTSPNKQSLLVFGRAAQRPFGTVSMESKVEIGARIAEELDG